MTSGEFPEPAVLLRTEAGAGRIRQTVHPLRLNRRGLAGFLVAWLFLPVVVFLVALAGGAGALIPALYIMVIAAVGLAYPFAALVGTRTRICEHGLIVSTLPRGRASFFIPYITIDTGSVMVHPVPRRGGAWRYKPMTAMNEDYPWPAMSQLILATCPVRPRFLSGAPYRQPLNVWGAPYSKHGISFRGCTRCSPVRGGAPARRCAGTRRGLSGCLGRCGRCWTIPN